MASEIRQLAALDTLEVSLVPRGANKKRFALRKEEIDPMSFDAIIQAVLEADLDNEENVDQVLKAAGMSDKAQAACKSMLKIATGFKDEMPKDLMKMLAKLAGYDGAAMKKSDELDLEALAPEVKTQIEALWKANKEASERAEKAEALLKAEHDARATREFVAKAATDFANLPSMKADEFGPVLKALSESKPEEFAKLVDVLKAADAAIKESALLAVAGRPSTSDSNADGAWAQIEKLADGMISKGERALTKAQAIDAVLKTDQGRALYQQYLAEHPRQAGA